MGSDETARVVMLAMQKGGVGKSTSTINFARAAALKDLKVLVVDLDPQGNTTSTIAKEPLGPRDVGIADAIIPEAELSLDEVIVDSIWPNVWLAPAITRPLTKAEKLIQAETQGREYFARRALKPVLDQYDLVFIDSPPALGLLTINGLTAADRVLVVSEGDGWSADGLAELRRTVEEVREFNNPRLTWAGVLINKWRDTKNERHWVSEIGKHFPEAPVWDERVPLWVGIKDLLDEGKGIDESKEERFRALAQRYGVMIDRLTTAEIAS